MQRPRFTHYICIIAFFLLGIGLSSAQSNKLALSSVDSLGVQLPDSLANPVLDSAALAIKAKQDSLETATRDSLLRSQSMLDYPVFSTAKDSIIEDFSDGKNMIYYYGDVSVTYGDMKITSDYMAYNVDTETVYAAGVENVDGVIEGSPQMSKGQKTYDMRSLYYNFGTQKSRINNMKTQEQEGFMHGDKLKMMPDQSINVAGGKYTVCDCEHPHYYLKMTAAKVVTQPTQRTVFGPAYLVVADVPLPLAIPFGFVPDNPKRSTGILFPTYGEEVARGFFLRDAGFYLVFGDHFDVALTGDIYSLGSWAVKMNSRYKLRYKFNGSLALTYSNDQTGEKGSTDFSQSKNFSVKWSHSQDPKALPGTTFSASVNFSSPSNNKYNNNNDLNEAINAQTSSSISFSKTWSKMSFSANMTHSQNSRDSSYSFTLPNFTFNVNRFFPFKRKNAVGKKKIYEEISFSYNTSFQNRISFKAKEINDPEFWDKMKNGMNHKFSIGLPSFTLFKYINLSPSVNYGMNWYFQDITKEYNPETDKVESVLSPQFSTLGITQDFSASMSLSTRVYGMLGFKKGNLKALRHMITPSLSLSYKPEMGTPMNGYRTYTYTDVNGEEQTLDYNRFEGGLNSPPGRGQTGSMSFSIGNNLEAKLVDKKDTTGVGTKKVKLIDQLSISGSYNMLADSMGLSTIRVSANTTIFKKMGLSGSISLDPYAVDATGRRYNEFEVMKTGNLFRLTNASFSTSYSFSGEGKIDGNDGAGEAVKSSSSGTQNGPTYNRVYYHPITEEFIPGGWVYYMNPNVPWSVNFSYSYSYSRAYQVANDRLNVKHNHMQTLGISGQLKLTKDLNMSLQSGVDLSKLKITTTQLSATYDLHCFSISLSWVPTGQWQSWNFRIAAKASALSNLLQYKKQSSYWDR